MHANARRVARMQQSEIRGNAANGSTGPDCASLHPGYGRHCERSEAANGRAMTGSAKQSSFVAATKKAGLLRRVAPRNDGERANVTAPICPTGKSAANLSSLI